MNIMRFFRSLRGDIYLCVQREWKYLFPLLAIIPLVCLDFHFRANDLTGGSTLDVQDYFVYIFGGMGEYSFSMTEPFRFPAAWMCIVGYLLFFCLRYPREDFFEIGHQLLIRTGSRMEYWTAKCALILIKLALSFLLCMGEIYLFAILTGGSCFEQRNLECIEIYGMIDANITSPEVFPLWLYFMPFLMIVFLAEMQLLFSFVTGVGISFLVMMLVLISSAYFVKPYLPGNFGMLYRNALISENGLDSEEMLLAAIICCVLMWIVGGILFCRMDLLKREELG